MIERIAVRRWGDPAQAGALLWPGEGSTASYFSAIAPLLPGRVLAVDPPGFGSSPPPDAYSYEGLVGAARAVIVEYGCSVLVGPFARPISRSASRTTRRPG
jgi:pimeloyl-ACP methyl ester carboxylesterase